jgi:hypothetical protein
VLGASGQESRVTNSPRERVVLEVVAQRSVSLDRAEMPCVDCFVGEPHVCPLLEWSEVVYERDEWGGYVRVS